MKQKSYLKHYALAAILAGSASAVIAEDRGEVDPQAELNAALASVASDRYGVISGIVAVWGAETGYSEVWEAEFTTALNGASDAQLLAIQGATSYDGVRAILQGQEAPVSMEGVAGPEALGSINQDLVFTPVVPCRIFDTRFDTDPNIGHPTGPATTKSYQVYGSVTTMQNQGGSVACSAPKGEPVGIHGNFTAAPSAGTGKGNIRAWPFGGTLPSVSLVNYEAGVNIANAATVGTCYLCSFDLNVTTAFFASDQIGDVMGYYYPADNLGNLVRSDLHGYDLSQGNISTTTPVFINPAQGSSTFTFTGGESVSWTTSALVEKVSGVTNNIEGTMETCYRNTSTNALTCQGYVGQTGFCFQSTGSLDMSQVAAAGHVASMPAGTYEFGFTMRKGTAGNCSAPGDGETYQVTSSKILVTTFKD